MPFNNRGGNHGGFANPGATAGAVYNVGGDAIALAPPAITTLGVESVGWDIEQFRGEQSNAGGPLTQNLIHYYPFALPEALSVVQAFWENGAVVNGNADLGVYSAAGTRLGSTGSTAQAGVSAVQFAPLVVSLVVNTPYYLAFVSDSLTGRYRATGGPSFVVQGYYGVLQQAATFPLPATATFATPSVANEYAVYGCTSKAVA